MNKRNKFLKQVCLYLAKEANDPLYYEYIKKNMKSKRIYTSMTNFLEPEIEQARKIENSNTIREKI